MSQRQASACRLVGVPPGVTSRPRCSHGGHDEALVLDAHPDHVRAAPASGRPVRRCVHRPPRPHRPRRRTGGRRPGPMAPTPCRRHVQAARSRRPPDEAGFASTASSRWARLRKGADRDGLADEADLAVRRPAAASRKRRWSGERVLRLEVQVRRRLHRDDAGSGERTLVPMPVSVACAKRRADEGGEEHAVRPHVVDERPVSADEVRVLDPTYGIPSRDPDMFRSVCPPSPVVCVWSGPGSRCHAGQRTYQQQSHPLLSRYRTRDCSADRRGHMSEARMKHGSETFFIEGEGLLTTQVGGRTRGARTDPGLPVRRPGGPGRRRPLPRPTAPPFHFSGSVRRARRSARRSSASWPGRWSSAVAGSGDVPAGYTYLGQFVDHDLTMDRTDVMLGEDVRPIDLLQGRSPRLDLDSLYGNGPGDAASAKFYAADGLHLKTGTTIAVSPDGAKAGHDLPRVGKGGDQGGQAQGADPRPAQRREPDRRADPPRDDPLPQQGRRQAARVGAGRAEVHPGPQAGHACTTSGWSATTTCRGSAPPPSSTTCSRTAASWSSRTRCRRRSRRCRSSSRWPLSGSGTA